MKIRYGANCAGSFQIVEYHEEVKIGSYKVTLYPAGHILGSAQVLIETNMKAEEIARKALKVASDICVFTNNNVTMEKI